MIHRPAGGLLLYKELQLVLKSGSPWANQSSRYGYPDRLSVPVYEQSISIWVLITHPLLRCTKHAHDPVDISNLLLARLSRANWSPVQCCCRTGLNYVAISGNRGENLPIVEMNVEVKASSENLNRMQVLPTPESPISSSLNSRSYVFLAIFYIVHESSKLSYQWNEFTQNHNCTGCCCSLFEIYDCHCQLSMSYLSYDAVDI